MQTKYRVPQSVKQFERRMMAKKSEILDGFANPKSDLDYTMKLNDSMDRYRKNRKPNFFAIVMPGGTGKTHLAERYGFVDIDQCVVPNEHEVLFYMRKKVMMEHGTWLEHDQWWFDRVNRTCELFDFSRPVIIMVHSEVMAYEIGALPLIAITLDKACWEKNISKRGELGKMFSEMTYHGVKNYTKCQMLEARTNEGVERLVLKVMNVNQLPIAAPNKHGGGLNSCYARGLPEWVYNGNKQECEVGALLRMHEDGHVPKECLDYFLRTKEIPASYGFGITMNDWSQVLAKVSYYQSEERSTPREWDPVDLYPYGSEKEKNSMNLSIKRFMDSTNLLDEPFIRELLRRHVGATNIFVTELIAYWVGLGVHLPCDLRPLMRVAYPHWVPIMKEVHNLIRISRFYQNTEMSQHQKQSMMYMEQIVGRRLFKVDVEAELKDRTGSNGKIQHLAYDNLNDEWSVSKYREDFTLALDMISSRVKSKPKFAKIHDYMDFFKQREEWLTKGSLVYNQIPSERRKYTVDVLNEVGQVVGKLSGRHNKKSAFETYEVLEMLGSNFELFNVTKAVEKLNELGFKDRTLLPGSLLHYLVFAYVLAFFDKQEQIGSIRINAPADDELRYMDSKLASGVDHLLFDWANFNAYHSAEEMELIVRKIGEITPAPWDHGPFVDAIADSMWDMYLEDNSGKLHKLTHGLFSGWRGTSTINGWCNAAYVECAKMSYMRIYGTDPVLTQDGGGDDIDMALKTPEDTYRMLGIMECMRFEAQKVKQMIGNSSELFRITYDKGRAYGNPTRALCAFVAGNWETSGGGPIREKIHSILDQVGKLKRRGVDAWAADTFGSLAINHWAKVKNGHEWLELPGVVIHGRVADGGFGVPDQNGEVWVLEEPITQDIERVEIKPEGKLAAEDYVDVLRSELGEYNIEIRDGQGLATRLARMAFDVRGDETYDKLVGCKMGVKSKTPVIEPKWDEALMANLMEYVDCRQNIKSELAIVERYKGILSHLTVEGGRPCSIGDLKRALGLTVNNAVFEFTGDEYYRRLIGEEWGKQITNYCLTGISYGAFDLDGAQEAFKTLCYMINIMFEHMV